MTEKVTLDDLFPLQDDLDKEIEKKHSVSSFQTRDRRLLALLVEMGEFANETRCFKFWSLKAPSPKERILDEYADALHFFLSLGLTLGLSKFSCFLDKNSSGDLSEAILGVYRQISDFSLHFDTDHFVSSFSAFLGLLPLLGYSGQDAIFAYKKKLQVNHERQEIGY